MKVVYITLQLTERHAIAFPRSAFTIICTIVEYSWPISWWKSIAILFQAFNIVFLLCARVGWCDVCTDFTNVIKVDVDVNKMSILNISHAQYSTALHVVRIIIFLSGMCLFCWQKCGPRPKLFLRLDIFSTLVDHIILTYLCNHSSQITKSNKQANDGIWIPPWPNTNDSNHFLQASETHTKSPLGNFKQTFIER